MKEKRGRPTTSTVYTPNEPKSVKICCRCFTKLYPGCNHSATNCKYSRREKVYNIEGLLHSPVALERIASRTINRGNGTPLATFGHSTKQVIKSEARRELFSTDDICGIQRDL